MIRRAAAVLLAAHGLVHLIGFVSPWRIASLEGFAYRTTVFGGTQDIGDVGVRALGLVWLALTFGFAAAGFGVWRQKFWGIALAGALAVASLAVCVAGLPETSAGVAINLVVVLTAGYVTLHLTRSRQLETRLGRSRPL